MKNFLIFLGMSFLVSVAIKAQNVTETKYIYTYFFQDGRLSPGEEISIDVPERYQEFDLDGIIMNHRQTGDKKDWRGGRDPSPGYTTVTVKSSVKDGDEWRYWGGAYSGNPGGKFAEVGGFEEDALYEWSKVGHYGINNRDFSKKLIKIFQVNFKNTGKEEIELDKVVLKFLPKKSKDYREIIFSDSSFGDPLTLKGRYYSSNSEMFKNALALNNSSSQGSSKLPENWTKDHSRLIITLDRPCALNHVDLMVGDLHPNGVRGWGKVSIGIRKSGPDVNWFTGRINIPPQGVINGTPKLNQNQLQAGDEIVISADRDTVYLMAARFACD